MNPITFQLNDMIIRHEVAGIIQLQMQFREFAGDRTFTYQMPFHLGHSEAQTIIRIREMETGIISIMKKISGEGYHR